MSAIDVQADSGYNQHFFVETHNETDTASVVTVVGQHKGGLVADSLTWGQPGSAQYFQRYKKDGNSGFTKLKTAVWGDSSHATVDVSPTASTGGRLRQYVFLRVGRLTQSRGEY